MAKNRLKIFSGTANRKLAEDICTYLRMPIGQAEIARFSDGEIGVKYCENIRGADVFIVQPTFPPVDHLFELLMLIDAARRASAKRITAVMPYFGYARQDRKDQPRVSISAKLVANILSTSGVDRILSMDLHNASIQGFFDIPFDHLDASTLFTEYYLSRGISNTVVVAPDIGSSKRGRAYANRLGSDLALVDKKRLRPNEIDTVTLIGEVQGKNVILVDDMIDTAGTLCSAANLLFERGVENISACCAHAILSGKAIERIEESRISKLVVTDSIPIPENKKIDKIEVCPSASLFAEAIRRIHNEESISSLFN